MSACYDRTIAFVHILDKAFLVVFACKTSFAVGINDSPNLAAC